VNTTHKNLTPRKGIILAGGSGSRLKSLALAYQDFLNQVARVSAA
jgi:dTDP-glucose pyrophosphorylase